MQIILVPLEMAGSLSIDGEVVYNSSMILFIHSFNKYILKPSTVSSPVVGPRDRTLNKTESLPPVTLLL